MLLILLQSIIDGFASIVTKIVSILPSSPFSGLYSLTMDSKWFGLLAYIIPIQPILSLLTAWILAVGVFYLYMILMRWAKAIE